MTEQGSETLIARGYEKLPDGVRCRCIQLYRDRAGNHWCCRIGRKQDELKPAPDIMEVMKDEIEQLRGLLTGLLQHERVPQMQSAEEKEAYRAAREKLAHAPPPHSPARAE